MIRKCRLVVYVNSLENCQAKASWVRIPPLPPPKNLKRQMASFFLQIYGLDVYIRVKHGL